MTATAFVHLVQLFRGTGAVLRFSGAPNECPACGRQGEPRRLVAHSTSPDDEMVEFAFQCPRAPCRRLFVGEYGRAAGGAYQPLAVAAPSFGTEAAGHASPWQVGGWRPGA